MFGNAFTGVADAEFDEGVALSKRHGDRSALLPNGITRIGNKVEQHLGNLSAIADNGRRGFDMARQRNIEFTEIDLDERQSLGDDVGEMMHFAAMLTASRERQQAASDDSSALACLPDDVERVVFFRQYRRCCVPVPHSRAYRRAGC